MPGLNLLIKPASSLCNLRCGYCFYADVAEKRAVPCYGKMSLATLEATVKRAFEYAEGYVSFAFQGGEPSLVGLDFYRELLALQARYNSKGIRVLNSIQTNGTLMNEEWATFLAQNRFLVGLSLDGTREAHDSLRVDGNGGGTYNRVIQCAEMFTRHGVEFNILCVVNRYVARYPRRVYEALKKYRYVQFIPCLEELSGEERPFSLSAKRYGDFLVGVFDRYYADFMAGNYVSIRNFDNYVQMRMGLSPESCAMMGHCSCNPTVEGDGSVYPCDFYVLDAHRLGNVHTDSFEEMIRGEVAAQFTAHSATTDGACLTCPYFALCRGGCRREREPLSDGKNRFCSAYRAFFTHALPKITEMAQILLRNQHQRRG